MSASDNFYQNLTAFVDFHDFALLDRYQPLPDDWAVAITDVIGSTQAIQSGRYQDVNALGVASIVAVLNAVEPLAIPYAFGGDGAIFAVPPSRQESVAAALRAVATMAAEQFVLPLRVGMLSVHTVAAAGHTLRVGKYQPNPAYQQAMFAGSGFSYVETLLKSGQITLPDSMVDSLAADFNGFECRWQEIPSPQEEMLTLLVQCLETLPQTQQSLYQALMEAIEEIYGQEREHHPLRQNLLDLALMPGKLAVEAKIRTFGMTRKAARRYRWRLPFLVMLGKLLMRLKIKTAAADWGLYKQRLIANTDYRKFDDVLRMVIAGTAVQRKQLQDRLEAWRQDGKIIYGLHTSTAALITCIVNDYGLNHVHFLDGANGGYALAAKAMKQQKQAGQV